MTHIVEQARTQGVVPESEPGENFLEIELPRDIAEREFGAEIVTGGETDDHQ